MYRVIVLYEQEPDADSYAEHVAVCEAVPSGVFRHGKIFGGPMGDPAHKYYAEWEFADKDAFKAATHSEEFMATGKDAYKRGLPQPSVMFADVS